MKPSRTLPRFQFLPEHEDLYVGFSVRIKGGVYHVQWRDPLIHTKQYSRRGGTTYTEVIETINLLAAKTSIGSPVLSGGLFTWQVIEDWFEHEVKPNRALETARNYAYFVERFILPALGALKFSKVTEPVLDQLFERIDEFDRADPLRKTHVGVTDSQVNTVKKLLKALFRWAQKEGYVLGNPAANLRQTHVEPAERTIYSPEEFEFLLHYVNSYYRPHLMVLYWSSIRPAELGALSWDEDIDFRSDGRVDLRIRHQLSSKVVGPTKTLKSKRVITLPMFIADALREHKEVQERTHKPHPQGLVFTTSAGNTFDNDRFRIRILYKAEELANKARVAQGLEPLPKVSPYGFRHSTLTVYSDVGASLPESAIQQHAGHTSQRTTDLYIHLDGKRREALAEIMESEHDAAMGKVLRGPDKGTA